MSWRFHNFAGSLNSTLGIHIGSWSFSVGWSRKDHICILSSLVTEATDVHNKSIFGDIVGSDVIVAAQKEKNFWFVFSGFESDTEFKSVGLSLASVEDVKTIPSLFLVHEP